MNLDTPIQYTLAYFISFMLQSAFYGIYCVIFAAFVIIQHKRAHTNGSRSILFYLVTANFIACTAYLVVDITAYQTNALGWLLASDVLYTWVDFISQVILIYRCWMVWRKPWVMVVPILLTLAFLGTSLACLAKTPGVYPNDSSAEYNSFNSLVLSFLSLSLAENALATGLIVYKILSVYRDIRGLGSHVGYPNRLGRDIVPIISIMIESGVITLTAQLVQTLMYKFDINTGYPIIGGFVVQLYGITTAIVIVRVEMGLSYDCDNKSSTTLLNFASSIDSDDTLTLP